MIRRFTLATVAAAIALVSCTAEPINYVPSDNPNIKVRHLLTIEGCRVYRFNDSGQRHYLTTCPSAAVSSSYSEICGRSCIDHKYETIQTMAVRP